MICPNCDSEWFGAALGLDGVVRRCRDCDYVEEATASEIALFVEENDLAEVMS